MKLTVELDNETVNSLINKGVEAMTAEECKGIVKQAMVEAFQRCSDFKGMLITDHVTGYSGYTEHKLGPLASKMLEACTDGHEFDEIREKLVNDLLAHHREILENAMLNQVAANIFGSTNFQENLRLAVERVIRDNRNN